MQFYFLLWWSRKNPVSIIQMIWFQWVTTSPNTSNTWKLKSNYARYIHMQMLEVSFAFLLSRFFISVSAWRQDELQGIKQRINVVVVENEKLQAELRSKAADESLRDYTLKNSMVTQGFISNSVVIVSAQSQQFIYIILYQIHIKTMVVV